MEEYLRSSERVTVRSRAMEEEEEVMQQLSSSKKRKLYSELEIQYFDDVSFLENSVSHEASGISVCTKHEKEKNIDFKTEISKSIFRETTPTSKLCGDSEQVLIDSSSTLIKKLSKTVTAHKPAAGKMASAEELEEFFSASEKYEQKRFAEKYNYDIAMDVPLNGRYKWEACNLLP
ncbi:cyclin-dependent kinase inhibitor 7-like isoform X2 [Olea europaea var. sylvestris]|uniref:Cyclin-dependent kinase inhibitor 7-like isoform X2 n=1 Tax=Olea europaea subsp. europaea TaxID=158383 RepID=A0A8S0P8N5_OLEEU|nr:cyclin-dependent kinase inhibitor 7-like isoform X2 [Olea europaea var. sylvestris]CAA2934603.1 cyclin-dependent kinase inhibitor 7-like isoform X2 [Olea europaea subsp. europaea]